MKRYYSHRSQERDYSTITLWRSHMASGSVTGPKGETVGNSLYCGKKKIGKVSRFRIC